MAMDLYLKDLYPNMGYENTRTAVQPETCDQTALVDDQKTGETYVGNPASKFNIFMALAALVLVVVLLGVVA